MKEQYVGDVSDYRKYALLRALSDGGKLSVGVCWMLTPPDGSSDGGRRAYLGKPERWRGYDPPLFDLLKSIGDRSSGERLRAIEQSCILPGARFFNVITPDDAPSRQTFMRQALEELASTDLIFFDPDNGLEIKSVPFGRKKSSKFLYRDEVLAAYEGEHSVLIYQHFTHQSHEEFIVRLSTDLAGLVEPQSVWAFRTPHVVFFLLVHPRHASHLEHGARKVARQWDKHFLSGRLLSGRQS